MLIQPYLSTARLEVTLTDIAGVAVTGATVTATVVDYAGTQIAGQTWPLTLSEVGSTGVYRGIFEHDWVVVIGQTVLAQILAVKTTQRKYEEHRCQVQVARS